MSKTNGKVTPLPTENMKTTLNYNDLAGSINLNDGLVLDYLTNSVADYIERESDKDIYKEAVSQAVDEFVSTLKLPAWLSFLKGAIGKRVASFLYENLMSLVVKLLRKIPGKNDKT